MAHCKKVLLFVRVLVRSSERLKRICSTGRLFPGAYRGGYRLRLTPRRTHGQLLLPHGRVERCLKKLIVEAGDDGGGDGDAPPQPPPPQEDKSRPDGGANSRGDADGTGSHRCFRGYMAGTGAVMPAEALALPVDAPGTKASSHA